MHLLRKRNLKKLLMIPLLIFCSRANAFSVSSKFVENVNCSLLHEAPALVEVGLYTWEELLSEAKSFSLRATIFSPEAIVVNPNEFYVLVGEAKVPVVSRIDGVKTASKDFDPRTLPIFQGQIGIELTYAGFCKIMKRGNPHPSDEVIDLTIIDFAQRLFNQ